MQRRWWGERRDLNPRQPEPQSGALPTELRSPYSDSQIVNYPTIQDVKASESSYSRDHVAKLVRPTGLEPVTYGLEGRCSIRLSYGRPALLWFPHNGRGRGIRTPDSLLPKQVRYQTAPCPDSSNNIRAGFYRKLTVGPTEADKFKY